MICNLSMEKKGQQKKNGTESFHPPILKTTQKMWLFFLGGAGSGGMEKKILPHLGALRRGSQEPGSRAGGSHPILLPLGMVWERWEAYGKGKSHYFGVVGGNPFKK